MQPHNIRTFDKQNQYPSTISIGSVWHYLSYHR